MAKPGIIWPESGSVFFVDPRDPPENQAITLRASLPLDSTDVSWWVDDILLGEVETPFSMRWIPTPGEHILRLKILNRSGPFPVECIRTRLTRYL